MFVRLWMTREPITITPETTVAEAHICLQQHRIRRLPVVDADANLVGIVSKKDLLGILPSQLDGNNAGLQLSETTQVGDIMACNPISVTSLTPLETVAQLMRKHKIGGVPVVDDDQLVGIITESDIFSAFMEVLGAGGEGARIEMIIGKDSRALYTAMDIFKRYGLFVQAITVHSGFSEHKQLLTIRVSGEEIEEMLDALRRTGIQINRIQMAGDFVTD